MPSTVVSLEMERNGDHSVTVYWQEPEISEDTYLKYFVIVNNDAGRFTSKQNYTIYQEQERKKYSVSVSPIVAYLNAKCVA